MTNKRFQILFFFFFLIELSVFGTTVNKTLYINRGQLTTIDNAQLPYFAFNSTSQYTSQSEVIKLNTTDVLILKVINNDSIIHGFDIKRYANVNVTINPKDSIIDTLQFVSQGVFIYYDSYQNPKFRYLGGSGMITVFNSVTDKKFYWQLKEHQSSYNNLINENKNVDWSNYTPDYFTINGYSFPDTGNDTTARVHARVGDTVHVFIANTGQSAHSIHFHGFHGKTIFSSNAVETNRIKDTFPIKSMESIIVELVPDKDGFYSVHDHNLLAISAAGIYQRGMLILIRFEK
ncbi:MAG TPA: multicopper oxidase domain-containing protein [Bacteroidia bacterium]|jgi:FtsP/CotA-like multicopper oxidase with cupredoxin domain|nr:multicopper oxidase domain-containing protein [Bacteroidia bacterium]HRG53527.1 multicopper oxidase domain-containing protein [Bacteroidia bacterium]